jgi:hypothetical protein
MEVGAGALRPFSPSAGSAAQDCRGGFISLAPPRPSRFDMALTISLPHGYIKTFD